jgi:(E)-4-hydroxy-3-methylbut-2-enyl-diphosphate synthase
MIKSVTGIGTLLAEGIGDTLRVSLLDSPLEEVRVGKEILKSLHLLKYGINFIACPTCGRLEVDLKKIVMELEKATEHKKKSVTVAVMGCAVNGPGEAREADIGVACGRGAGLLYKNGKQIAKVPEDKIVSELIRIINEWER